MLTQSGLRRAVRGVLALGVALAATLLFAVPTAQAASGPADAQATEMVRLINGVRWANNLPALSLDPNLAGLARDTPISCPADASQVMLGRARDFATYGPPSHYLRLCPSVMFVSVLQSVDGYQNNGEIDLNNLNYGTGARLLSYAGSSHTWQTWTYYTNQAGILGWMNSPTHSSVMLGGYDRVGCGGWISADGTYFYDCLFSQGGPGGTVAPPTAAPFNNPLPTAQPTPAPTPAPTPKPTPRPTLCPTSPPKPVPAAPPTESPALSDPTPGASGTVSASVPTNQLSPTEAPTSEVSGVQRVVSQSPDETSTAANPTGKPEGAGVGGGLTSGPPIASSIVGVAAGGIAGLLAASYGLLVTVRKRANRRKDAR